MSTPFSSHLCLTPLLLCGAWLCAGEAKAQVKLDAVRGADGVGVKVGGAEKNLPELVRPSKALRQELRAEQEPIISDAFAPGDERGAFLGQMKRGELTPEAAWNKGLLTRENVFKIAGPWRDWSEEGKTLRLHLLALLAERAPEILSLNSLPVAEDNETVVFSNEDTISGEGGRANRLEVWSEWKTMVAQYYRGLKDARAVLWYEAALKDWQRARADQVRMRPVIRVSKTGVKRERDKYGKVEHEGDPTGVTALGGLARYYTEIGDHLKAAQTWKRAENYSKNPIWLAEALIETAWVYPQGEEQNVEEALRKVPQYNFPWATHAALWGLARLLIEQDRHDEVRKILNSPLQGEDIKVREVAVSSLLGSSYYRSGEFELSKQWSRKALAQYEDLPQVKPRMGLDVAVSESSERLWWIEQWKPSLLVCWPPQLDVSSQDQEKLSFNIRSFREVPLSVTVDDPRLRTTLRGEWQSAENGFCFDREVAIDLLPSANKNSFDATITVTSSRFPDLKQKVKVHINQAPILDTGGG